MKKIVCSAFIMCSSVVSLAQKGDIKLGIKLVPIFANLATIKDNNRAPSGDNYVADGYTTKEGNRGGVLFGLTFDYGLSDRFSIHTGLWFAQKNYFIRNTDGNYSGVSMYNTTYMQIPIVLKYTSKELFPKFRLYGAFGPTIDFRTSEKLQNGDYAHYWNMATNNHISYRDKNAANKKVALFNPIDISLYFSAGATYEVIDNLDVYAGFFLSKGLVNQVNPKLRFDEPNQTKVNTDQTWKSCLIGMEFGVTYRLASK